MTDQTTYSPFDSGSRPTSWAKFCTIGCFTVVVLKFLSVTMNGFDPGHLYQSSLTFTPFAIALCASNVGLIAFGGMALYWYMAAWTRNNPAEGALSLG